MLDQQMWIGVNLKYQYHQHHVAQYHQHHYYHQHHVAFSDFPNPMSFYRVDKMQTCILHNDTQFFLLKRSSCWSPPAHTDLVRKFSPIHCISYHLSDIPLCIMNPCYTPPIDDSILSTTLGQHDQQQDWELDFHY